MEKTLYIRKPAADGTSGAPTIDRFTGIEKVNRLVASGWVIKDFRCDAEQEYFVLEKAE